MTRIKRNSNKQKIVLATIALFVLAGGVAYALVYSHKHVPPSPSTHSSTISPPSSSNNTVDATNNQSHKEPPPTTSATGSTTSGSTSSNNTSGQSTKTQVTPRIVTSTQNKNGDLTVNGEVIGVAESGGTCTLKLVKGSTATPTYTHPGEISGQSTTCGQIIVPRSDLSPGEWQATISYSSSTSKGVSAPQAITVQ